MNVYMLKHYMIIINYFQWHSNGILIIIAVIYNYSVFILEFCSLRFVSLKERYGLKWWVCWYRPGKPCRLFPFGVALTRKMRLLVVGDKLAEHWGDARALGQPADKYFQLRRPRGIPFDWTSVSIVFSDEFCTNNCLYSRTNSEETYRVILQNIY